ncbi:alpha/beta hydrolase [Sphaerisporangium sp. NPDC005289]|uniref:alpha/beta hydrolase n=1 Tax=Sphaerisporangium sp. NPDC005289 TaxID=3155247 RepID=UPI0033ADE733
MSFGNPDEADNIVTYVPGTGSTLAGIPGDAKRAAVLWDRANSTAQEGKQVASMVWLGYEAPQWGATLDPQHSVALPIAALRGAPELASFTDGLRASHQPDSDVGSTMLGHSYGSLLTGVAARLRPGHFADQLIFIGSPGVEALRAKDLHVKQAWVGEAPNDPVGDIGHVNPSLAGIVAGLGPFGSDPSSSQFGAKKFLRDISKAKVSAVAGQVQAYWKRQGHLIQAVSKTGTSISGRSRPDDFLLSLSLTGDDVLTLGAGSPCIWPSGTPDSTAQAS